MKEIFFPYEMFHSLDAFRSIVKFVCNRRHLLLGLICSQLKNYRFERNGGIIFSKETVTFLANHFLIVPMG